MSGPVADPAARQRLDKWLWFARFFKTRSLSAKQISGGAVRVNATRVTKPATPVAPGDVLTFAQGDQIRVIRIDAPGQRRGPAPEAQALYTDLTPVPDPAAPPIARKGPRPTKKHRRDFEETRRPPLE